MTTETSPATMMQELVQKIQPYLAVATEALVLDAEVNAMSARFAFDLPQGAVATGKRYVMLLVEIADDEQPVPVEEGAA